MQKKVYVCMDLKSFYASVECSVRGLDPFQVNLVVADPARGRGALCMAVTPHMKEMGVNGRCRIFDIPKGTDYITAKPRMRLYMEYAGRIYKILLKFIAKEDIHVYSVDESFLDVTSYLRLYRMTAQQLTRRIMNEIYDETAICATAGIGTNLFLAKVALDILSKRADDHMGYLNESSYKQLLWHHRPITDFWQVGQGIARRLLKYGIRDMWGVAHCSKRILQKEFGINGVYLYDHAWGREPTTMEQIKNYRSKGHSLSNHQILFEDYDYNSAFLVLKEMVDINVLTLTEQHLVTDVIGLYIGYSNNLCKPVSVVMKVGVCSNSYSILLEAYKKIYQRCVARNVPIRRIGICFQNVKDEAYEMYDLFTDIERVEKEKKVQSALVAIKQKYGKNAVLKGMNFEEKATARKRNLLIGGHNAE